VYRGALPNAVNQTGAAIEAVTGARARRGVVVSPDVGERDTLVGPISARRALAHCIGAVILVYYVL